MRQKIFYILGVFVLLDLLFLDYIVIRIGQKPVETTEIPVPTSSVNIPVNTPIDTCGPNCQAEISNFIASLSSQPKPTLKPQPVAKKTFENYIPMGAGSTALYDWTTISGAGVYIDTSKYGNIKEAYFEAQLRIPTGNGQVCARVLNKNDNVPLGGSEICSGSATGFLMISPKISLSSGNKLYELQMKVTMPPYEGFVDLGRIKLTWEQ